MAGLHDAATTCDVVVSALRRFPDRVAFRVDGRDISYREAEDTLQRWVAVLLQRGVQPDQGVGLLSLHRPAAWVAQAAPALAGGHCTALDPLRSPGAPLL